MRQIVSSTALPTQAYLKPQSPDPSLVGTVFSQEAGAHQRLMRCGRSPWLEGKKGPEELEQDSPCRYYITATAENYQESKKFIHQPDSILGLVVAQT